MHALTKTILTWLLTCLLGTLALLVLWGTDSWRLSSDFGAVLLIAGGLSLASSIPGMIAYHFIALAVSRAYSSKATRRLILSVSALLLVFVSAGVVPSMLSRGSGMYGVSLFALLFYGLPFVVCVFLFDYRENVAPDDENASDNAIADKRLHLLFIIITLLFAIPFLQSIPNTYHLLGYIIPQGTMSTADSFKIAWQVLHSVAVPAGVYLFWKRNKTGWATLFYLGIAGIISIVSLFRYYQNFSVMLSADMLMWWLHIASDIVVLILLNNRKLRHYLEVSNQYMLITAAISVAISLTSLLMF